MREEPLFESFQFVVQLQKPSLSLFQFFLNDKVFTSPSHRLSKNFADTSSLFFRRRNFLNLLFVCQERRSPRNSLSRSFSSHQEMRNIQMLVGRLLLILKGIEVERRHFSFTVSPEHQFVLFFDQVDNKKELKQTIKHGDD